MGDPKNKNSVKQLMILQCIVVVGIVVSLVLISINSFKLSGIYSEMKTIQTILENKLLK